MVPATRATSRRNGLRGGCGPVERRVYPGRVARWEANYARTNRGWHKVLNLTISQLDILYI